MVVAIVLAADADAVNVAGDVAVVAAVETDEGPYV